MATRAEQLNRRIPLLSIRCGGCGEATSYDLVRQNYHCLYCGAVTETEAAARQVETWQAQEQHRIQNRLRRSSAALQLCPGCGCTLLTRQSEAKSCLFCGETMEPYAPSGQERTPPLYLPFALTLEEAKEKLRRWAKRNIWRSEARRALKNLDALEAVYLPVQLVQGPVELRVSRPDARRAYLGRGLVEGVAVNCSAQMDSLLLSVAEPFDWSQLRCFSVACLDTAPVKLRDLPARELEQRVAAELAVCCTGAVERSLGLGELSLEAKTDKSLQIPVLAPVFLLNAGGAKAVINGQNGRIALCRDKPKRSRLWLLEPLILSLLATLFWLRRAAGDPGQALLGSLACTILAFGFLSGRRGQQVHKRLFGLTDPKAQRLEGRFLLSEEPPPGPGQMRQGPVFLEEKEGRLSPVEIRYFTPLRVILLLLGALTTVFLPYWLAGLLTLPRWLGGGAPVPEMALGAIWYVAAAATLLLIWPDVGRSILFDRPRLFRRDMTGRRLPVRESVDKQPPLALGERLRRLGSPGALAGFGLGALAVLVGSLLAMLSGT